MPKTPPSSAGRAKNGAVRAVSRCDDGEVEFAVVYGDVT
jgi:hypothetical protein